MKIPVRKENLCLWNCPFWKKDWHSEIKNPKPLKLNCGSQEL
jgi:hypothetical protein